MAEKKNNFEEELQQLQQIVSSLENGQVSLDEALTQFQAGVRISKDLKQQLTAAESTVAKLIDADGHEEPLDPTDASAPKE